ncbi:Uncharacterized conserved protein, DUF2141 family [Flavobacterium fluvii]|uniref:Uncharacterized conserved protein, DUF2141 family n=1 Tax=Flavobacterium fluvii TaxID=468056 RepID=A0A1M5P0Y3_9FLAO|nr:DUF2141 domain-containing protein [Flavobacterium fluvii]SHG95432.1 Uncharacterized conserved protein, DUF2141 family [Flavobacterium fluvii]
MLKHFIPILLFISSFGFAQNPNLSVSVSGIKNNTGSLTVELYNSKGNFLKTSFKTVSTTIKSNSVSVTFNGIPKGEYTVLVYHDENKNGKLDKNLIGMPKESVACSNNAKGFMGPPKYDDAKFTVTADTKINIKMTATH